MHASPTSDNICSKIALRMAGLLEAQRVEGIRMGSALDVAEGSDFATRCVRAGVLDVAYREIGPNDGWPVILTHGFPYDPHCFSNAARLLASRGAHVILPWMRGFGDTAFVTTNIARSGQQGAFGTDLLAFMDALDIERATIGGFDWGGRASCIVAALWPERVEALVTAMGYNILDPRRSSVPATPEAEHHLWYIWYFHSIRGPSGLAAHRKEFCRLLWQLWSPKWEFSSATFEQSAVAFENPDFVDVVIHSYRYRFGLVTGDPAYDDIEQRLAELPSITVPTVVIDGEADPLSPPAHFSRLSERFLGPCKRVVMPDVGHNPAQENPVGFADAVMAARALAHSPAAGV